jgi:hypothetical protein
LTIEEIQYLFSNLGVPTVAFIMMYVLYNKNQKWWQEQSVAQDKRHEKNYDEQDIRHQEQLGELDKRHQEISNKFIEEINKIYSENKLENKEMVSCINILTLTLNTHIKQKDELVLLTNNNLDLLRQKDNTISELFNMLKDQIRTNGRKAI